MYKIEKKTYSGAPINFNEVARYAGAKTPDENLKALINSCVSECEKEKAVNYAVCFAAVPISISGDETDFSAFTLKSKNLVSALRGAESALIFACTAGVGLQDLLDGYEFYLLCS